MSPAFYLTLPDPPLNSLQKHERSGGDNISKLECFWSEEKLSLWNPSNQWQPLPLFFLLTSPQWGALHLVLLQELQPASGPVTQLLQPLQKEHWQDPKSLWLCTILLPQCSTPSQPPHWTDKAICCFVSEGGTAAALRLKSSAPWHSLSPCPFAWTCTR